MQSTVLANFSTGSILYIRLCKGFAQTVMGDYEAHPHTLHIATSKVRSPIPIPQPSAILSERLNPFFGPSYSSDFSLTRSSCSSVSLYMSPHDIFFVAFPSFCSFGLGVGALSLKEESTSGGRSTTTHHFSTSTLSIYIQST